MKTPRTNDAVHRFWMGGLWSEEFANHARRQELELNQNKRTVAAIDEILRDALCENDLLKVKELIWSARIACGSITHDPTSANPSPTKPQHSAVGQSDQHQNADNKE
jgi:hypothetical protein